MVVLLPPVWLALTAGLPGVLLAPVLGGLVQPLLTVAGFGATAMVWMSSLLDRIPHAALYLPPPGWVWLAACYGALIAVAFRHRLRLRHARIAILACLVLLSYLAFVWRRPPPERPQVIFIATGPGNAVLLRSPEGANLLFDAGGPSSNVGERVIASALWALGVRRLDALVLSHADSDHCNGFPDIAERFPIGHVLLPERFGARGVGEAVAATLKDLGDRVIHASAGDRLVLPGMKAQVLWPPRDLPLVKQYSDNELSAVLCVDVGSRVMLTGDFGRRATRLLLRTGADMHADILQVSHHGRPDYAAEAFAEAVSPSLAVIPGGRHAQSPSPYAAHSGELLSTSANGMVRIEVLDSANLAVTTHLDGRHAAIGEDFEEEADP